MKSFTYYYQINEIIFFRTIYLIVILNIDLFIN